MTDPGAQRGAFALIHVMAKDPDPLVLRRQILNGFPRLIT